MSKELADYLSSNHSIINVENDFLNDLSLLDEDAENHKIFLVGENHGVKANRYLRMKFLKYFKVKTNFKYYLCELPYSMTCFLNKYIETGDEIILKDIYEALKGTDAWNLDEYNHWKDLYEYNKSFSNKDKIIAIGIDIEHQPKNAFKFFEYTLKNKDISKLMKNYMDLIGDKDNDISDIELGNFHSNMKEDLNKNEKLYRELLKDDFFNLKLINDNLLSKIEVYTSNNFNGVRDKKMQENFLDIYTNLPKDKFYGQMGLSHIFQKPFPYENWFGAILNREGSNFQGKIISIAYAYKGCKYLYPTTRKNYVSSIDTLDDSIEEFKYFIDGKYTLFKLNKKESPFKKNMIWPLSHKFPEEGVTADYFQYLVVIKDSEEMKAFEIL